jgi:two-component system, NarL family, response regulator LiaR
MPSAAKSSRDSRRRALRNIFLYGLAGGILITVLKLTEYRLLVVEHSLEIYGGVVAAIFAALGIWLGLTITRKKSPGALTRSLTDPTSGPFIADLHRLNEIGITPRELEILGLIAAGLSNREIAARLFVSENTVKTHSSRLFDKLGARRRTQAVRLAKEARLIP